MGLRPLSLALSLSLFVAVCLISPSNAQSGTLTSTQQWSFGTIGDGTLGGSTTCSPSVGGVCGANSMWFNSSVSNLIFVGAINSGAAYFSSWSAGSGSAINLAYPMDQQYGQITFGMWQNQLVAMNGRFISVIDPTSANYINATYFDTNLFSSYNLITMNTNAPDAVWVLGMFPSSSGSVTPGVFSAVVPSTTASSVVNFGTASTYCASMAYVPPTQTMVVGCSNSLYTFTIGTTSPTLTATNVGAGIATSMAYYQPANLLYIGSSIGLGLSLDATTFTIKNVMFIPSGPLRGNISTIYLDVDPNNSFPRLPMVYWGSTAGYAVKTTYDTLSMLAYVTFNTSTSTPYPSVSQLSNYPVDNTQFLSLVSAQSGMYESASGLYSVTKTKCSVYSCSMCTKDYYCGWCYGTATCTTQAACTSGTWGTTGVCPAATALSRTTGSTDGGYPITIGANFFDTSLPTSGYRCVFTQPSSLLSMPALYVTNSSVTCNAPFGFSAGATTVTVTYNSLQWMGTLPFSFYSCETATTCSSCVASMIAQPDCGWCISSGTCTDSAICDTSSFVNGTLGFGSLCPTTTIVTPPTISTALSTTSVSVNVAQFPATTQTTNSFLCYWDFWAVYTAATAVPAPGGQYFSSFTCQTPSSSVVQLGTLAEQDVLLSITTTSALTVTAVPGSSLIVFNCSSFTQCDQCASFSSTCGWCPTSGLGACMFLTQAASCSGPGLTESCASLSAVSPSSVQLYEAQGYPITLQGNTFASGYSSLNCLFSSPPGPGYVQLTTLISAATTTTAQCPTPSSSQFTTGRWDVTIANGNSALMTPVPFYVYDCSTPTSCVTCVTATAPACRWCSTIGSLGCSNSTTGCTNSVSTNATCPIILSATPSVLVSTFNNVVDLSGSSLVLPTTGTSASALHCALMDGSSSIVAQSALTVASANSATCEGLTSSPGSLYAYILDTTNNLPYSTSINVTVTTCEDITSCTTCLDSGCFFCAGACNSTCADNTTAQDVCPMFSHVTPPYADLTGTATISIFGSGFLPPTGNVTAKRAALTDMAVAASLTYDCHFGTIPVTATWVSDTELTCVAPTQLVPTILDLSVTLQGHPYISTSPAFEFFTCPGVDVTGSAGCVDSCISSPHCGWCVTSSSCSSQNQCPTLWESDNCTSAILSQVTSYIKGGSILNATLSSPLPASIIITGLNVTCHFGSIIVPANVTTEAVTNNTIVSCVIPDSPSQLGAVVPFSVWYLNSPVTGTQGFDYVDCAGNTQCSSCQGLSGCGWCKQGSRCTVETDCPAALWSTSKCPVNSLALGLGLGFGLFFLILLALLVVYLIRRARKTDGLVVKVTEPDYDAVAWGSDNTQLYKVPEDRWQVLNAILARKDYLLQLALSLNCPPTEQDTLAKGLVFVSCAHGDAPDMIKTVIRAEVASCLDENTLFRNNSVASKMYKFFSRIVGIKYLFHCIARVIKELEALGSQSASKSEDSQKSKEVSLLTVSMELNPDKEITDDVDTDTNLLQLQLIVQKIVTVLIKTSLKNIPTPLRQIFVEIDQSVTAKFPHSLDAVYKGLGGLFFLRFVCPAITAPHVYGLLDAPPNTATQRQLVLITKVIQSIANMQPPGKKEQYMEVMGGFINSSIPRIKKFYDNLRTAANISTGDDIYDREIIVPEDILLNGLAATQGVLVPQGEKIKAWVDSSYLDAVAQNDLIYAIDECLNANNAIPKKQVKAATDATTGAAPADGKKKKKKKTEKA